MSKRYSYFKSELTDLFVISDELHKETFSGMDDEYNCMRIVRKLNTLTDENEQLQNQIDELEDDNEKYSKSLDKLEDYTKRFIPTKCLNEFKDCKTNRYYWLDHEGNLEGALELLNLMDCENKQLKSELEAIREERSKEFKIGNGR